MLIFADILSSTILFAVPLLLVALGGMFSERSGIINIALEGIMIIGALLSCLFLRAMDQIGWGAQHPQFAVFLAILVAALSGAVFSMLLAFASVHLKANQTIGGTALNMLAPAFAIVLTWAIQGQGQTTIAIPKWVRITSEASQEVFFNRLIFKSLYLTTPIAILLLIASVIILYKTRLGLRLRSCGEHPQAADSVGVNVYRMRYAGVAISGALAGVGGLVFVVPTSTNFNATVAGYGFLALAVLIFGQWRPSRILFAAFFFGLMKTVASAYSGIPFLANLGIPNDVYKMVPYVATLIVLAFTSKNSMAPRAEGIPYDKGSR